LSKRRDRREQGIAGTTRVRVLAAVGNCRSSNARRAARVAFAIRLEFLIVVLARKRPDFSAATVIAWVCAS
jgi:hypothetical protein